MYLKKYAANYVSVLLNNEYTMLRKVSFSNYKAFGGEEIDLPFRLKNSGAKLGNEYRDVIFGKQAVNPIKLGVTYNDNLEIEVEIALESETQLPFISKWSYKDNGKKILEYTGTAEKFKYKGLDSKTYTCKFSGLKLKEVIDDRSINLLPKLDIFNPKLNVRYVGPFRKMPPRVLPLTGFRKFRSVGVRGQNVYYILGDSKRRGTPLIGIVDELFKKYFDGWGFDMDNKNRPFYEPVIKKMIGLEELKINLADVGQGLSQILPIVVQSNLDVSNSITVFEQPELHLHPAAHGDVAELIADSAKGHQDSVFLIETHSENFIHRIRKLIVDSTHELNSNDVAIYWVEVNDKSSTLEQITINNDGELSSWPEGVFEEGLSDVLEINKLRNAKN